MPVHAKALLAALACFALLIAYVAVLLALAAA